MRLFTPLLSDCYKVSHRDQYPSDTQSIYSNLTARSSRMEGVEKVIFFGLQYFIKEYLIDHFNRNFFWLSEPEFDRALSKFKRRVDNALQLDNDVNHWRALRELGYLPLEIRALPEGARVPLRVPLMTIKPTVDEFFWLGQWVETLLSNTIWHPITVATIADQYKVLFDGFARETSDMDDFVPFQGHDFSMRGHSSVTSSIVGGAGHLLSFVGTDTLPAIDFLEEYYGANSDDEIVGVSCPATEHSVMTVNGEEGEFDTIKRLITEVYPTGVVSIVSDSYNLWRVLTDYLPRLRNEIMSRDGMVSIRPDSGDPVEIICGDQTDCEGFGECSDPIHKGVIRLLWDTFGGTTNSKGYRQLDSHVGCIYGDSITLDRARAILTHLKDNGFASTNFVAGIGSYTYQYLTRDTFGLAFKATARKAGNKWYSMFKNPITDSGMKRSAKGLLMVQMPYNPGDDGKFKLGNYQLLEDVTETMEQSLWNMLHPVFRDGKLLIDWSLEEIRLRMKPECERSEQ